MQTLRAMVSLLGGFSAWRVQSGRVQSGRVQSGRVAMRSGTCGRVCGDALRVAMSQVAKGSALLHSEDFNRSKSSHRHRYVRRHACGGPVRCVCVYGTCLVSVRDAPDA